MYSGLFGEQKRRVSEDDDEAQALEEDFATRWGWLVPLNEVSGNDIRLREAWLRTGIIDFLNHISMIKEKRDFENHGKTGRQY